MDFTTPVGWMPPFHICKIAIIACTILKFFAWPCFVKWVRSFYSSNWMGKGTCWNCAFFMFHKVHSLNFSNSAQLQISWSKLLVFLSKSCSNLVQFSFASSASFFKLYSTSLNLVSKPVFSISKLADFSEISTLRLSISFFKWLSMSLYIIIQLDNFVFKSWIFKLSWHIFEFLFFHHIFHFCANALIFGLIFVFFFENLQSQNHQNLLGQNHQSQNHKFPKLLEKHSHKLPMNLLLLQMSLYCLMSN